MINGKRFGLSLSGGGYRAAAFHLGTLTKLHEMKILSAVDVLSTISGGSITGAYYCLGDKEFGSFKESIYEALTKKSVIRCVLLSFKTIPIYLIVLLLLSSLVFLPFTGYAWVSVFTLAVSILLIALFQFRIFPVSSIIEEAYDKFFFHGATLSDLRNKPLLAIGSTNIQTCRPFTFSKVRMEDSTYSFDYDPAIKFNNQQFPVARAVMASSCVPFAFTPVGIGKEYFVNEYDAKKINPQLVDGGVYDNQGIHKLTQKGMFECSVIVTSDAGNKLPFTKSYNNVFVLLIRTMDVFMARIKNFQMMQHLYNDTATVDKEIAYLSLGWDIDTCIGRFIDNLADKKIIDSVITGHQLPEEWVKHPDQFREDLQKLLEKSVDYQKIKAEALTETELTIARKVGTNLTCLKKQQVDCLSRHAASMTELQLKLYCPVLFTAIPS